MRQNILLSGMIIPAMLYMQNISAQTAKELQTNIAYNKKLWEDYKSLDVGNLWKDLNKIKYRVIHYTPYRDSNAIWEAGLLPPDLKNTPKIEEIKSLPLKMLVKNLIDGEYKNISHHLFFNILRDNLDIQKLRATKLLQNPNYNTQELHNKNASTSQVLKMSIMQQILLEQGVMVTYDDVDNIDAIPVVGVKTTKASDPYINDLLGLSPSQETIPVYVVSDGAKTFIGTQVLHNIVINQANLEIGYVECKSAPKSIDDKLSFETYMKAIYGNELLHIHEANTYGDVFDNDDTIPCKNAMYTKMEIGEFMSDAISLQHDHRYLMILIENMLRQDGINLEEDPGARYRLSQNILKRFLRQRGFLFIKKNNTYYIDSELNIPISFDVSLLTPSKYIYQKLSSQDIIDLKQLYFTKAKEYKGYLDAYRESIQNPINSYEDLWKKLEAPMYKAMSTRAICHELLQNPFIKKEIKKYLLDHPSYNTLVGIGEKDGLWYCLIEILLEQGKFIDPDRQIGQEVFTPIIDKHISPVHNASIEEMFHQKIEDTIEVYSIYSNLQSYMGVTLNTKVIANQWSILGTEKIAQDFKIKGYTYADIMGAVITNEKAHYATNKIYGDKIARNEIVATIGGHYKTRNHLSEFLSDAASVNENEGYLFTMISNFLHAKHDLDPTTIQEHNYALTFNLLEEIFNKYNISSTPDIPNDFTMLVGGAGQSTKYSMQGETIPSAAIYNKLTPQQIAEIKQMFMQTAKQYVGFLDEFYKIK